ncbi:MAG: PQQ-dependent sugar dehydrogenase [Actinomycetes bacterium]
MPNATRAATWVKAPMVPDALGYVWVAGQGLLRHLNIERKGHRRPDPSDILLPTGYEADVVVTDLDEPVHLTFAPDGTCYLTEGGYRIDSPPRIWQLDVSSGTRRLVFEISEDRWNRSGCLTGCAWHDGWLYYAYNDHIGRFRPGGDPHEVAVEEVVTELPSLGDHQVMPPTFGPDGKLYFGTGSATNCGVVGADNIAYEWLRNPALRHVCDIPGADVTLTGQNFETQDVKGSLRDKVRTGAFVPFGTETRPGQVIPGRVKCTGGILRCNPDGSDLELVAWGFRSPFGLHHSPDGRLLVADHGIDERGSRFVVGDPDDFYEVIEGEWYGFPDYAAGKRLDDPSWTDGGRGREPVIADPPGQPPAPLVTFTPHAAANGFDFSPGADFGFAGDVFIACFGDAAPVTTRRIVPAGFKVARIDMARGRVVDFAVNRIAGGASVLPHDGFERPVDCRFGPDGSLYVVDWGEMVPAPERGGVEIRQRTGVVWRIRRTGGEAGQEPPEPLVLPVNLLRLVLPLLASLLGGGLLIRLVRRLR